MAVFISSSEGETFRWAEEYAKTLRPGDTVLLDGEMGAGKTLIAKGIAKGLGISEEVTSPTYAYINSYEEGSFTSTATASKASGRQRSWALPIILTSAASASWNGAKTSRGCCPNK